MCDRSGKPRGAKPQNKAMLRALLEAVGAERIGGMKLADLEDFLDWEENTRPRCKKVREEDE